MSLGRLPSPDTRDRAYLLPRRSASYVPRRRLWYTRGVLDQLDKPHCVAFSWSKWLTTHPVKNSLGEPEAAFYLDCQRNDAWPGEDYEGTSVRAGANQLKARGFISEYRWAFDSATALDHVLGVGPMVVGTTWWQEMLDPDPHGYIAADGGNMGGHAWLVIGADRDRPNPDGSRGAIRMINSWGPNWGPQHGRAWVTFADFEILIADGGEACAATEI